MNHKSLCILVIACIGGWCASVDAQPTAFTHAVPSVDLVGRIVSSPPDLATVVAQDEERDLRGDPYRFAVCCRVTVDVKAAGTCEVISPEVGLWRLRVSAPGATSLSLGFTTYRLPAGATLFVYSTDGCQVLGPYAERQNMPYYQLWTPVVNSDDVVIELTAPWAVAQDAVLILGAINYGYRDLPSAEAGTPPLTKELGESARCNINVATLIGSEYRDQIRSVARYTALRDDAIVWGTGALINSTAEDGKPYFLTAFHVFDEYDDGVIRDANNIAPTVVLYWNYQASKNDTRYDYASVDVPKPITDFNTVRSDLVLSQEGTISDLNVRLNITHPYDADLDVFLIAPDGTRVELFTDVGGRDDNFTNTNLNSEALWPILSAVAPFNGSYRPEGQLAVLYGKKIAGTWSLEIRDDASGNQGTLNSWSLIVNAPERQTQTGVIFRAAYRPTDFCLLELVATPPADANAYYAGWDRSAAAPEGGVAIHHPQGDLKKISVDLDPLSISSFYGPTAIANGIPPFTGSYMPKGRLSAFDGKSKAGIWKLKVTDSVKGDSGALQSWSMSILDTAGPVYKLYASADVPKTIVDANSVTSTLIIADPGTIADVDIKLTITHTRDLELTVTLIGPDGTQVELFAGVGGTGDDFVDTVLDDESSDGTHLMVSNWDVGTTEDGSSGCPLFNGEKRIVGQLHGGDAACSNSKPDWFGRLYLSWTGGGTKSTRLSDWLDPLNTGKTALDGRNASEVRKP